jgi:hypothetical protein
MKTAKTKPPKSVSRFTLHESASASALIIAVVLTSLLAIIGVMFVMIARVDKMATSAISENKELNFAVETVVAKISQELVLDVPGMPKGREYYDYPGEEDKWLASLEPYEKTAGNYYWRQISDVYNKLPSSELIAEIIPDYQDSVDVNTPADADGDGVADSNWVIIPDMTSSKGKPIYAAIRIVDNGGMINVNTAYEFDPNGAEKEIDGSSQTQINLLALSERGSTSNPLGKLDDARFGSEPLPHVLDNYIEDVVWRYNEPNGLYTPFDISDELKLRNRYILNYNLMTSRIEQLWSNVYDVGPRVPLPTSYPFSRWPNCTILGTVEPNDYDYRHISTTYNTDRIIDPNGDKMLNVNDPTVSFSSLYSAIRTGLYDADPNFVDANGVAAQIAVNLIDFRDNDSNVTSISVDGSTYYGFESPCIYISELAHRFVEPNISPLPLDLIDRSYAIELYKPYLEDDYPESSQWQLDIQGYGTFPVNWSGSKYFYVIYFEDASAPLTVNFDAGDADPNLPSWGPTRTFGPGNIVFSGGKNISLQRKVSGDWITVDSVTVPFPNASSGWLVPDLSGVAHSIQRDITLPPHKCIRRLWASAAEANSPTLGTYNDYFSSDPNVIQAHPEDKPFTNVGEIGMLFRKPAYYKAGQPIPSSGVIGYSSDSDTEDEVRIDLADPNFQQLFKYLTVWPPSEYVSGPNETRIKGRININTAPWYVLAQLPWVSQRSGYNDANLARAIVAYRDKLDLSSTGGPDYYRLGANNSRELETGINGLREEPGFESIGELATVINNSSGQEQYSMNYYTVGLLEKNVDLTGFPDLTPSDGVVDDFKERDVIFARISNLVTVRSDVFTAYILVRIGSDGPQKRAIAILDRSDVYSGDGKVRIIALHPVPDPR